MQEQNFTSIASEWNSKWGAINNALRFTYSYQNEPRTYEGGTFPTVDILDQGSLYAHSVRTPLQKELAPGEDLCHYR